MEAMKRWGIAKKSEDQGFDEVDDAALNQPYAVIIRPAIADLLGEAPIARLAQFRPAALVSDDDAAMENEQGDQE